MADDQALTIAITADVANATGGIQSVEARLAALEQAFVRSQTATSAATVAVKEHSAAHGEAAKKMGETEAASGGLASGMKQLTEHSRTVAMGLNSIGLESEAAVVKLEAMTSALEGMEAAFPPLLAIAAIIGALTASFDSLKEGVSSAADLEGQMTSLGTAVKLAGGNWDEMSESVKRWAEIQEQAVGTDINQSVGALNELVTAGASVRDAMYEVSVSEDVAAAKHISLKEAVNAIVEAEAGRATGLARLDARLKPLIQNHAHLSTIIAQLASDMKGQAASAADTYGGAAGRLHAAWDSFKRGIGDWMLPWLTDTINGFVGFGAELSDFASGAADWAHALGDTFKGIGMLIVGELNSWQAHINAFWAGVLHQKIGNPNDQQVADGQVAAGEALINSGFNKFGTGSRKMGHLFTEDEVARGHHIQRVAENEREKAQADHGSSLDFDPVTGNARPKGAKAAAGPSGGAAGVINETLYGPYTQQTDQYAEAQKRLEAQLHRNDDVEASLKSKIELAGTAAAKRAAQAAYDAQVQSDLYGKQNALNVAMDVEKANVDSLTSQRASEIDALNKTAAAHDALAEKKVRNGGLSAQEQAQLTQLADTYGEQKKTVDELTKKIGESTSNLQKNQQALAGVTKELDGYATAAQRAAAAASLAWEKFANDEAERMAEERETANLTNAQKVTYYQRAADAINAIDAQSEQRKSAMQKKADDARLASMKDLEKAHDEWAKKAEATTAGMLGDIIIKHKSFKDELKSIYDDILKAFVDMVAKMIVQSALFGKAFGNLGGGGAAGGGWMGALASSIGGGGGGGSAGPKGSSTDPLHVITADSGAAYNTNMTGSPIGIPGVSSSGGAGALAASGGFAIAMNGLSGIIGGNAMAQALEPGGNKTNGMIGSAVGAGAAGLATLLSGPFGAAILASPWGAAILGGGALLGGLVGGALGPHYNESRNPDIVDPTNYGTSSANFYGRADNVGHAGNNFTEDQALASKLGGMSQLQYINEHIADLQKSNAALADEFRGATSQANFHEGNITLNNGTTKNWADLFNDANSAITAIQNNVGANGPIPTFSISRSYPDAQNSTLTATGSVPAGGTVVNPNGGVIIQPGAIIVQGNVIGQNGMDELTQTIGNGLYKSSKLNVDGQRNPYDRSGGGF